MIFLKTIEEFLSNRDIAVIGASTNQKKFGYIVFEALRKKHFNVFPVNPNEKEIDGIVCYPEITSLPDNVKAAVFITKPDITLNVIRQICENKRIKYLWLQQGSENYDAIALAEKNKIKVVQGECILMYIKESDLHNGKPASLKSIFRKKHR
jgi:predicted CoA-binding protein